MESGLACRRALRGGLFGGGLLRERLLGEQVLCLRGENQNLRFGKRKWNWKLNRRAIHLKRLPTSELNFPR